MEDPGVSRLHPSLNFPQRILATTSRSEAITHRKELPLEDRLQNHLQGRLHDPILERRNPQGSGLPLAHGNVHTPNGFRPVSTLPQFDFEFRQKAILVSPEALNAHPKDLLKQSLALAKFANISIKKIVLDPAIGFFRKTGTGPFFTKINSDWLERDLLMLNNLRSIKMKQPLLVSVSNKSFIGKLLNIENISDRLFGSIVAEAIAAFNGADIIRTHNVRETKDTVKLVQSLAQKKSRKAYNAS